MNIKEAEVRSGVSKQNIRFYERQGLLSPARDPGNDYREYTEGDIRTLKRIRLLRTLDMPLETIREVLRGNLSLSEAAEAQTQTLKARAEHVEAALRYCGELSTLPGLEALDEDRVLERMDRPQEQGGLFSQWADDYRKVAQAEGKARFTFVPDDPISTPAEFSAALFRYAEEHGLDLVITKESMYPVFTMEGVEYTATRGWSRAGRFPTQTVCCEATHPEELAPADVPQKRRKLQQFLHRAWLPVLAFLALLLYVHSQGLLDSPDGWALLLAFASLLLCGFFQNWYHHWNENGKRGRKDR